MSFATRNTVFICYAHRDRRFLEELHEHLAPLRRTYAIEVWDDTRLKGGEEWRDEIKKALASARLAICLVSSSFRASKFIAENELPPLLSAAKAEGVTILPVIVGHCDFTESELAGVQAENEPSKPLDSLRRHQRHAVWVKVVRRVRELLATPPTPSVAEAGRFSPVQKEPINRLRGSLSPDELIAYCADLNRKLRFDEAVQQLEVLVRSQPDNHLAWFEYSYALARTWQREAAFRAFVRAYNGYLQLSRKGVNDIKFPMEGARYAVFGGTGSGTYGHGLPEKPNAIFKLGPQGTRQVVVDSMANTTVHVTNKSPEPWVILAAKFDRAPDTQARLVDVFHMGIGTGKADEDKVMAASDWYRKAFWQPHEGGASVPDMLFQQKLREAGLPDEWVERIFTQTKAALMAEWRKREGLK